MKARNNVLIYIAYSPDFSTSLYHAVTIILLLQVGFELIDAIAEAEGISITSKHFKAMVGKGNFNTKFADFLQLQRCNTYCF
jgi:hypothetical protein